MMPGIMCASAGSKILNPNQSINVVLAYKLDPELVQRVQAVSPRLHVLDAGDLVYRERRLRREGKLEEAAALRPSIDEFLVQADVLFSWGFPFDLPKRAPHLDWVQVPFHGADNLLTPDVVASPIRIATAQGLLGRTMAEHVLGQMIYFSRRFHIAQQLQRNRKWDSRASRPKELSGQTVGIVGYGDIARNLVGMAKAQGMRCLVVRRSISEPTPGFDGVEQFLPPSHLDEVVEVSDFLVLAAPRTPENDGMVGEEQIRRMKPGAYLINVGRGSLIDEAALIQALQEGRIAGAGLDVFQTEPLPEDSPLWDMPNVMVTPHNSGPSEIYMSESMDILCDNLRRYLASEPLLNIVDKERWY
jgi:phosphoglycerate dehydrogenase-like enzyme